MRRGTAVLVLSFAALVGACSSSSDDTSAPATEAAAPATEPAPETEAAETPATDTPVETLPADTAPSDSAPTESAPAESVPADSAPAAGGDTGTQALISGMLKQMSGTEPNPDDVACISGKLSAEQMTDFMAAAAGDAAESDPRATPIFSAIFSCKPASLVTDLAGSFDDMPAEVTQEQKECVAGGLMEMMGGDPDFLQKIMTVGEFKDLAPEDKANATSQIQPKVEACIGDAALVEKVMAELGK